MSTDIEAIRKRLQNATGELDALCAGKHRWTMTVPTRDDDSDIVIDAALADIPALLAEVERLRVDLAETERGRVLWREKAEAARAALERLDKETHDA